MLVLSNREKALIAALVGLLLVLGLYFVGKGLRGHLQDLESRVRAQEAMLQRAAALTTELQRLQSPLGNRPLRQQRPLISYVEELADRVGVRDRIQLNLIPTDARSGVQGLDIKLERLSLDELVQFLYTLENADQRLVIDQLDLSPSFRDKDLLRLSMRVLARG